MFPHRNSSSTKLHYSRLLMATIDFDCTNHVDTVNEVNSAKAPIIEDFNSVISSEYVTGSHRDSVVNAKKFVECFDTSVPTTCCYQIVSSVEKFDFIQFFCLPSLGLCYQIKSFWSHCFMAAMFSYFTSVSIFIYKGKVYVWKFPWGSVFAWGKGGSWLTWWRCCPQ